MPYAKMEYCARHDVTRKLERKTSELMLVQSLTKTQISRICVMKLFLVIFNQCYLGDPRLFQRPVPPQAEGAADIHHLCL